MKYDLNQIILADCMDVMADIPDKYFELAIVDPPYGLKRFDEKQPHARGKHGDKTCSWDEKPTIDFFVDLSRISKFQIIWGGNNFDFLPPSEYFIIWNKEQTVDNFASAEYAWTNCKIPAKIFTYSIHKHNQISKIHPTQKPVALYRWLLQNYAKTGDKIIDTHSGSGSCAIACHIEKHDFLAIEKDPDYHAASVARLKDCRLEDLGEKLHGFSL